MKSVLALLLIAFVGFAFSQSQVVDPGYKSSEIQIADGDTGYFRIPIDGLNGDFCNPLNNTDIICGVKVEYSKHPAGVQRICISWEPITGDCTTESATYFETLGVTDGATTKNYFIEYEGGANYDGDLYIYIGGKCKTSDLCASSTDADIKGVRIYEATGVSNGDDYNDNTGYTSTYMVPFEMDADGSNTAKYTVNAANTDDFAFPSMAFEIAAGGEDHYILLDIDELADTLYAVEFHYTWDDVCGLSSAANNTLCYLNNTNTYVFPDSTEPVTGDYGTGPITLEAGFWGVTPYVYSENVQSSVDFRFCGAIGYECASASGLVPSIALFATLLLAIIAYLF